MLNNNMPTHAINLHALLLFYSSAVPFPDEQFYHSLQENMNDLRSSTQCFMHIAPVHRGAIYITSNFVEVKYNIEKFMDVLTDNCDVQIQSYLFMRNLKARKFSTFFTVEEMQLVTEGARISAPLTLGELCAFFYRYLENKEEMVNSLLTKDLPYRSRTWIKNTVEYMISDFDQITTNNQDIMDLYMGCGSSIFSKIALVEYCIKKKE